MKHLLAILILTAFNLEASASCMVWARTMGTTVNVNLWKHTENKEDDVLSRNFKRETVMPLAHMLKERDSVKFIFNNNKFTSMSYDGKKTIRWDDMTEQEKDVVRFVRRKFDVGEH